MPAGVAREALCQTISGAPGDINNALLRFVNAYTFECFEDLALVQLNPHTYHNSHCI